MHQAAATNNRSTNIRMQNPVTGLMQWKNKLHSLDMFFRRLVFIWFSGQYAGWSTGYDEKVTSRRIALCDAFVVRLFRKRMPRQSPAQFDLATISHASISQARSGDQNEE